jgi:predicted transcriptional regulator
MAGGLIRVSIGHGLPPQVKEGLKMLAYKRGQSVSWVLEQVIIEYFDLQRPVYIQPKKKPVKD